MAIITAARKPKELIENAFNISWLVTTGYPGTVDGTWNRIADGANPAAFGDWSTDTQPATILRQWPNNSEGVNQSVQMLEIPVGSFIMFRDNLDPLSYVIYEILAPGLNLLFIEWSVSVWDTGSNGSPIIGSTSTYSSLLSPVQLQIFQSSFYDNQAEDLGMNVSPFAQDRFVHLPQYPAPLAPNVERQNPGGTVEVFVQDSTGLIEEYTCYDGWIEPAIFQVGLSTTNIVRKITADFQGYISVILEENIAQIEWLKNGQSWAQWNLFNLGLPEPTLVPVATALLFAPGDVVNILFKDGLDVVLSDIEYQVVCPYEDTATTIGFLNRYGFWEFFDCVGRSDIGANKNNENYISAASGLNKTYLTNGNRTLMVNTGWQDEGFFDVIEDLLMSNEIVLYTGDSTTSTRLILKDTQKDKQTSRHNKVEINYELRFETAAKIIPIV
jgi:hypothetical protein